MYIEHKKPPIPAGFQSLPVGATAVALTVPDGARYAIAKVTARPIKWRDDGGLVSSTTGMSQSVGDYIELTSRQQLTAFRGIVNPTGATGVTGVLEVSYYKI